VAAFEIRPYPELSWSISRQRLLDNCPRAYYYRYYAGWNGWLAEAPERTRLAYRLSKLTGLEALLGQEIDRRAREVEASVRAGRPVPSAVLLEERTRMALRDAWRSSREDRAAFEAHPKDHVMLRSFYLEGARPSVVETDRLNEKLAACHENLVRVAHWDRLLDCADEGCVLIPEFARCFIDEVGVYGAPDMAYVHGGTLYVIDWKSGRAGADDPLQVVLASYCLVRQHPALAGVPVQAGLHYLLTGEEAAVPLPPDHEALVLETVAAGLRRLRTYLRDVEANAPLEEGEFERRESGLCPSCNYVRLCEGARS